MDFFRTAQGWPKTILFFKFPCYDVVTIATLVIHREVLPHQILLHCERK